MRLQAQALAALGAAGVDDGAAATGLHADEEAVGAGAAHFGGLVGAFHDRYSREPMIILEKTRFGQGKAVGQPERRRFVKARKIPFRLNNIAKTSLWTTCGQTRIRCFPKTTISTEATAEMSEGQTNSLA